MKYLRCTQILPRALHYRKVRTGRELDRTNQDIDRKIEIYRVVPKKYIDIFLEKV